MSTYDTLVQYGSYAALGYIGYKLFSLVKAQKPSESEHVTGHTRWIPARSAGVYANGSKRPIRDVKQVGPISYVVTDDANFKYTINTHNIGAYLRDRHYQAPSFTKGSLHPDFTRQTSYV